MPYLISPTTADRSYQRLCDAALKEDLNLSDRLGRLRRIMEDMFSEMTRQEIQIFPNFFARQTFVFETYKVEPHQRNELNQLRSLCNKSVHNSGFGLSGSTFKLCVRVLAEGIQYFSGEEVVSSLQKYYAGTEGERLSRKASRQYEQLAFTRAIVLWIGERIQHSKGNHYCDIRCKSEDPEVDVFTLRLWDARDKAGKILPGLDYSRLHKDLWEFASLNLYNLNKVAEQDNFYSLSPQSYVVLEPDYLMDATEVAKCFMQNGKLVFANPHLALLSRITPFKTSIASLTGQIVNDLLDRLILDPRTSMKAIFKESLRNSVLPAVRLGGKELLEARYTIEKVHFPNLQQLAKHYQQHDLRIEPSFFSESFGMQGRLDGLIEYEEFPYRKEVFELKSGNPHSYDVWVQNKMQVVCYNLLLKSVFDPQRHGSSSIFYSKAERDTLRNVASTPMDEQWALMIRNRIVARFYKLSQDDYGLWEELAPDKIGPHPSFKQEEIRQFGEIYQHVSVEVRAYFHAFISFMLREIRVAKVGDSLEEDRSTTGFSALWKHTREEKEEVYAILSGLKVGEYLEESESFMFQRSHQEQQVSNFRVGDIALIYPEDKEGLFPLTYQILKCSIREIHDDRLVLELRNKQVRKDIFKQHDRWVIEHDFMESGYNDMLVSLYEFLIAPQELQKKILGSTAPRFAEPTTLTQTGLTQQLLPSQTNAISKALSAKDYFLIQGPPGTGKTSRILGGIVEQLYRFSEENVAILAFTNRAVNEICHKLEENDIAFIRLGKHVHGKSLFKQIENKNYKEAKELIEGNRIYVATISSFLSKKQDLLGIVKFDTLAVDEASQLMEPHLSGILQEFRRTILIGDQNQLPAVSLQKEENCVVRNNSLLELGFEKLNQSMFERLWNRSLKMGWEEATLSLQDHFRMHDDIAGLLNHFYDGKLRSNTDTQQAKEIYFPQTVSGELAEYLQNQRVLFFESESGNAGEKYHQQEARRVQGLLQTIKVIYGEDFDPQSSVGVITPWRAQINAIQTALKNHKELRKVSIDTVERFQGSEKDIIIVSLSVNHPAQLKSLNSLSLYQQTIEVDRKLNVALSRAKSHVILLGDPAVLSRSKHYLSLLEKIRARGGYVSDRDASRMFKPFEEVYMEKEIEDLF